MMGPEAGGMQAGKEAQRRVDKARAAQVDWGRTPTEVRARRLRPLRVAIAERMDEILAVICDEVGKPAMDALTGDIMVTLEQLRFYERSAAHTLRSRKIGKPWVFFRGTRFKEWMEPHGVVLVCAPWNYPLQLSVVPMVTALFAGNTVLLKCSEHTPRTARMIEELCIAAGLPDGLVQVSCEAPEDAAALLDARPDFVFFTGSYRNGRIVAAKAAELMVPTVMELGGKDAALVFDSCDVERTANGLVYGSFSNAGQVCVGTKRIYVQQGIHDAFLRIFLERVERLRVGTNIESDLGQVKIDMVRQWLDEQIEDAVARGAKLHSAWQKGLGETVPVVLTAVPKEARLLQEETFGPVVCVAPFHSEADAIQMANESEFALSASVWTGSESQGERVAAQLQCGCCVVNDVIRNIGNPEAAFGGNRSSGYGRYRGAQGLKTFSRVKTVMTVVRPRRAEIHWFPFRLRTFAIVHRILRFRHGSRFAARMRTLMGLRVILVLLAWQCCVASVSRVLPRAHGESREAILIAMAQCRRP
jgi:acyl-CoA reductase-like NAD-dependent aldehyde dehydrogenase